MKAKQIPKLAIKGKPATRPSHAYPVYRATVSTILTCICGVRYIKTRTNQDACIKCFVRSISVKA